LCVPTYVGDWKSVQRNLILRKALERKILAYFMAIWYFYVDLAQFITIWYFYIDLLYFIVICNIHPAPTCFSYQEESDNPEV
jgi:hypothetical protein